MELLNLTAPPPEPKPIRKAEPKPRAMKLKEFERNVNEQYPELVSELSEFISKCNFSQDEVWIGSKELFKLSVSDGLFYLQKEKL